MTGRGLSKKQAARDTGDSETKQRSGKWMPWHRREGVTQKRQRLGWQIALTARRKGKAPGPAADL